jgi:hypothetical protein
MRIRGLPACGVAVLLAVAGTNAPLRAQPAAAPTPIYSCTNAAGKKLTSDRPIPECNDREQRVLNSDGSIRTVIGPPPTVDERAAAEAREHDLALEQDRRREAIRRDHNLVARFPNEAAHRKARLAALDDVKGALRLSEARLAALALERKPLDDETEFYIGKPLPIKLKALIDANDASVEAQRALVQNQKLEVIRIDQLYDAELERLRRLWGGAQPGSMGMIAGSASAPSSKR